MSGGFKVELKTTILPSKDYQSMESVTKLSRDCPKANVNTFKNRLDRHWREQDFLYNHEAPIPGHHLAEDRAKRFEQVDLTIEANAGLRS